MKTLAILGAVLAITAASAANAASKPQGHDAGGPMKRGQFCWIQTNEAGAGWWDRCDNNQNRAQVYEIYVDYGGGGGGGGR